MKKYILIFMFFEAMMNFSFAQNQVDTSKYYKINEVSKIPEFPGGKAKLLEFLSGNIQNSITDLVGSGSLIRVIVSFSILRDGSINNIKVKEVGSSILQENQDLALNLMKKMPKWIPAKINEIPVNLIEMNVPIYFSSK